MSRLRTKIRWSWNYFWRVLHELFIDIWKYYISPYPILLFVGAFRRIRRRIKIIWLPKARGRPPVDEKVIDLIIEMKRCNLVWGSQRISDELKLLGISVSKKTILKILRECGFIPPKIKFTPPSWKSLLNSYARFWSMDFTTIYDARGIQLFVFVVLEYPSRKIIQIGVTGHPSKSWLIQQFRNSAVSDNTFPVAMVHDRDGIYGKWLPDVLREFGMKSVKTSSRSPWQNCFVERFNLSIKTEVFNRLVIANENHARELSVSYQDFYNSYRPHQGIAGRIPCQHESQPKDSVRFNGSNIEKTVEMNELITRFSLVA